MQAAMKAAMFIVCFARDSGYTEARKVAIISNYITCWNYRVIPWNLYLPLSRGMNGGYDSRVQVVHQLADQDSVHDPLPSVI